MCPHTSGGASPRPLQSQSLPACTHRCVPADSALPACLTLLQSSMRASKWLCAALSIATFFSCQRRISLLRGPGNDEVVMPLKHRSKGRTLRCVVTMLICGEHVVGSTVTDKLSHDSVFCQPNVSHLILLLSTAVAHSLAADISNDS